MVEVFVGLGGKDTLIVGIFPMYSGTSSQQDISGLKSQDFTPTWDEIDSLLTSIKVTE